MRLFFLCERFFFLLLLLLLFFFLFIMDLVILKVACFMRFWNSVRDSCRLGLEVTFMYFSICFVIILSVICVFLFVCFLLSLLLVVCVCCVCLLRNVFVVLLSFRYFFFVFNFFTLDTIFSCKVLCCSFYFVLLHLLLL